MDIIRSISATLLLLAVYTKTSAVEAKRWAFISSLPRCRHLPADNRLARQHGVPDDNIDSSDSIESGSHKKPPAPSHSFVEGESYDDDIEEIMAMGGDPSFMDSAPNPSHSFVEGEKYNDDAAEIMAMGGDPFFMGPGGGEEEEDTVSRLDDTEDDKPTSSILSSMAGMGGGVMDVIGNVEELYATVDDIDSSDVIGSGSNSNTKENPPVPPPRHSFVEGESYDDDIAEIMAMGGDPFFMDSGENEQEEEADSSSPDGTEGDSMPTSSILSSMAGMGGDVMDVIGNVERDRYATDGKGPSPKNHQESSQFSAVQDDNWEWDGIVDEDAHFDFD